MEFHIKVRDKVYDASAEVGDDAGRITTAIDGRSEELRLSVFGPDRVQIQSSGLGANLFIARDAGGVWVWTAGRARYVTDATTVGRRRGAAGLGGADTVTPPTPAAVTRVMVEVGQAVEKGTALVTVSAMKMEMTLCAPYAGVVVKVNARPGDQVAPGDILVEIDPRGDQEANNE